MSEQKFKKPGEGDDGDFSLGFKVPSVAGVLQKLESATKDIVAQEHQQLMEEEDKEDKKQGRPVKKRVKRPGKQCCFCGDPSCRIGPFTETRGEEGDA